MRRSRRAGPVRVAAVAAVLGLAGCIVGAFVDPGRTAFAWLVAFAWVATLAVGCLALVMIHHLTSSSWFIVLRREAEQIAEPLLVLPVLFLPVLVGMEALYPWADPWGDVPPHVREEVLKKTAYLDPGFFTARSAFYLGLWGLLAGLLARWSRAQEAGDGVRLARRQKVLCAALVPVFGFVAHFAAVDWLMSLEPAWVSSIFGVYVFASGLVGGLALLVLVSHARQRRGELLGVVRVPHYHAAGKLLHTFVIFWAYVAFFQFFLIWIGDLPSEVAWFVPRTQGRWLPVALFVVVGHFAVPFFALLFREVKRDAGRLAAVAGWLVAVHFVHLYWIVMPAHEPTGWTPHWVDAAALAGVGGAAALFAVWRARDASDAARGDPRFERSLRFETR